MHLYRTHTCGALRAENIDEQVRVSGWVHRKRDHGGLLFIDLRDHYGLTQLVIEPSSPHFALAEQIRAESVIRADGKVVAHSDPFSSTDRRYRSHQMAPNENDIWEADLQFAAQSGQ